MSKESDCNVHGPEFREAKPSQGHPSRPVSELFRLDNRTIIITGATGFLGTTLAIAERDVWHHKINWNIGRNIAISLNAGHCGQYLFWPFESPEYGA